MRLLVKNLWRTTTPKTHAGTATRLQVEALEGRDVPSGTPLTPLAPTYLGPAIVRGDARYDLQPAALSDPGDTLDANHNGVPDRQFKMWWLGRYQPGDADKAPSNLYADDRIYFAYSENGVNWSRPEVALKGSGGLNGNITADDHLLGSPSVLKVGAKYYMFYEAYGDWVTPLNRFYSFQRGDNWVTNEQDIPAPNNAEGYAFELNLGFAPLLVKAGTHPVYSGEVIYTGHKYNRYLSTSPPFVGQRDGFTWTARVGGNPAFWLYNDAAPGRKGIYSFFDTIHSNTYATDNAKGDVPGSVFVERLGYAAESLDSPDMIGSLQNRIVMATSTDGVNWTRFQGPARGGAVIAPQDERTSHYDPITWTIKREYGSGFPSVLERDGYLELYFTDAVPGMTLRRVRLPLSQIENPAAWQESRAPNTPSLIQFAASGGDIKWSPNYQRYFSTYVRNETPEITDYTRTDFRQSTTVRWSDVSPDPSLPPEFSAANEVVLPGGGRVGVWGALLADGLGHVLTTPNAELHVYSESYRYGGSPVWDSDIVHASVRFATPFQPGAATGRIFLDSNGNGRADAGEGGLAGWIVYHDANGNGRRDSGEISTTTGASGVYRIELYTGYYGLRAEPVAGWVLTSGANGFGVNVTNGAVSTVNDFGAYLPGKIQGVVFTDGNRNGRQDAGEAALAGWVVYLDANNNGRLDPGETQTTTDSTGCYQVFVIPGSHRVRVVVRSGYASASGRTVSVAAGNTATIQFAIVRR